MLEKTIQESTKLYIGNFYEDAKYMLIPHAIPKPSSRTITAISNTLSSSREQLVSCIYQQKHDNLSQPPSTTNLESFTCFYVYFLHIQFAIID